jgi:hypothetical protein
MDVDSVVPGEAQIQTKELSHKRIAADLSSQPQKGKKSLGKKPRNVTKHPAKVVLSDEEAEFTWSGEMTANMSDTTEKDDDDDAKSTSASSVEGSDKTVALRSILQAKFPSGSNPTVQGAASASGEQPSSARKPKPRLRVQISKQKLSSAQRFLQSTSRRSALLSDEYIDDDYVVEKGKFDENVFSTDSNDVDQQRNILQKYIANNGLLPEGTKDSSAPVPDIDTDFVLTENKMERLFQEHKQCMFDTIHQMFPKMAKLLYRKKGIPDVGPGRTVWMRTMAFTLHKKFGYTRPAASKEVKAFVDFMDGSAKLLDQRSKTHMFNVIKGLRYHVPKKSKI